VEAIYLEFLGRVPDKKGMLHYIERLEDGDITLSKVCALDARQR